MKGRCCLSDIKLFKLSVNNNDVVELMGKTAKLEKDLQAHVEKHMEVFLGIRFLATEYNTGKTHKGRIDSLGLDENGCPVIVEYKRNSNENVINQGLFYLDWLMDHQAEYQLLVMENFDQETAKEIDWSGTRLVCIASDFNKYDEHAVQQINRNIELLRYKYFADDLLLLELVNAQTASTSNKTGTLTAGPGKEVTKIAGSKDKSHADSLAAASTELLELYNEICDFADNLGDEVQRKELKLYTAFKRIKNFASVLVLPQNKDPRIHIYLKVSPQDVMLEDGFINDVTHKGHWGTGNLEVVIRTMENVEKAKYLITQSFDEN
jgi:predicted transport protein